MENFTHLCTSFLNLIIFVIRTHRIAIYHWHSSKEAKGCWILNIYSNSVAYFKTYRLKGEHFREKSAESKGDNLRFTG